MVWRNAQEFSKIAKQEQPLISSIYSAKIIGVSHSASSDKNNSIQI